ncbi:RluA family pseudouridine synthase [Enterococcus moraviensis ATCC BAA-383]|uniref:Pseudouridine synthase n=1 Tax=Enterococcus moraviensis ATCC BAA-383 TaxID=1158609 RepID=R2TFP0_9ENTE|nr:RluA family pseudouridine synthase [Enterococcus moraviensis]EOH98949.1 RluA family pseudouridine synthase [Enterococcus moraviensis ATCC BAA-383]EOT71876.1 ribosomal large subunit pseudouridine synthase [Enterococcus moraviensis ATCC BAA-383]OJG67994.1 RluA family pseudouridine synthase [Enterococcus moraviensis]
MEFSWIVEKKEPQQVKSFLKEQGVSKGLLAKVKFQGGKIEVNQSVENALFKLSFGDQVKITIPDEKEHETLLVDDVPIDIVFEDEHYLVVNKPAGVASIPAQYHPNGTMANRVKAYYKKQQYKNQVIHVVTRLDRDTTGLMLFAKHGFAHAMLDQELRKKEVVKIYQALVGGVTSELKEHTMIQLPIGRDLSSILKRTIVESGQQAETEYWLMKRKGDQALVNIQLHTGRTHQIRVHFEAIGCPLLGDDMYGGKMNNGMDRQALHCCHLRFNHPFTKKRLELTSPLAEDMRKIVDQL